MSKNIKKDFEGAKKLTLLAAGTITSGDLIISGKIVGIAVTSAVSGEKYVIEREVVANLVKKNGDTFAEGDVVYWDASPGECTSTSSGNTLIGHAVLAQIAGDLLMDVLLLPNLA
jgi:predicted RecA/RadA family phage recombinase